LLGATFKGGEDLWMLMGGQQDCCCRVDASCDIVLLCRLYVELVLGLHACVSELLKLLTTGAPLTHCG
jgi:hypothetical protein